MWLVTTILDRSLWGTICILTVDMSAQVKNSCSTTLPLIIRSSFDMLMVVFEMKMVWCLLEYFPQSEEIHLSLHSFCLLKVWSTQSVCESSSKVDYVDVAKHQIKKCGTTQCAATLPVLGSFSL